ncbi:MAG: DMT family transporter [bacterium]|nr:DMT family transporter [bacterium]
MNITILPSWLLIAVLAGLASNLYNFYNRKVLQDDGDSTAYAWWTEFLRFAVALAIVPFDFSYKGGADTLLVLILVGIVEIASSFVYFKMHKYAHLSISTIISRTRLIWVPILAFLVLGEKLATIEYAGIFVLFFGLSVAVSPHKLKMDKGVQFAYLSAVVVAVLSIVMKLGSSQVSTSLLLVFMSVTSMLLFPIFMKDAKTRILNTIKKNPVQILLASGSNIAAMYLYVYALRIGDVSKVMGVYQGMMIVSVLAGIFFLGERLDVKKKIIGSIVTIVGIVFLAMS